MRSFAEELNGEMPNENDCMFEKRRSVPLFNDDLYEPQSGQLEEF